MAMPPAAPASARASPVAAEAPGDPVTGELRHALSRAAAEDAGVAAFYSARGWRPLWVADYRIRPEARTALALVQDAAADGLRPEDYGAARLATALERAAEAPDPHTLAAAERLTSTALAAYIADLHRPKAAVEMIYADAAVRPWTPSPQAVLETLAKGPSLATQLAALRRMNPLYEQLRAARKTPAARGLEPLIRANLERARALPADPGRRYVLVDAAAQTLWVYENGKIVDSMRVVVGKVSEPTPMMAGLIRYAVFRPYWNIPPDLVRKSVARKVLQQGRAYLDSQNFEALSDWTETAQVLDPSQVDWAAVAAGRQELRMRQRPGPGNMMGTVKFIFPNELGVYLHDTPIRSAFASDSRNMSAGCVRLQHAPRLAERLLGSASAGADGPMGAPEQRVDLAQPVPVYLTYLTVAPTAEGLATRRDVYGRDAALLARLGGPPEAILASR
jgi:murein L,D-transpeptidase YcbB/YkuD